MASVKNREVVAVPPDPTSRREALEVLPEREISSTESAQPEQVRRQGPETWEPEEVSKFSESPAGLSEPRAALSEISERRAVWEAKLEALS